MSELRQALKEYLRQRRALGFQLRDTATALRKFVDFLGQEGATSITVELALRWARQPKTVQPAQWANRLGMVRRFAEYRSAQDPRTEIPAQRLLPYRYRRITPYPYSDEQIDQLLQAARQLPSATGLRAMTYTTFLGLLAVTGMRMGEAVKLDREDVDFSHGILTLRQTKFGKSRYLPLHTSTQQALSEYQKFRHRIYPKPQTPSFFLSEPGRRLKEGTVRATFVKLSRQIALREPAQSRGPRLHDLRHRFAVKTLTGWYRSGRHVQAQLPKLASYLGHGDIKDTYWYLTGVPELLQQAVLRLEEKVPGEP